MDQVMMQAFADEFEKIAMSFKNFSPLAKGHAETLKSLGGVKKARAAQLGANLNSAAASVGTPIQAVSRR